MGFNVNRFAQTKEDEINQRLSSYLWDDIVSINIYNMSDDKAQTIKLKYTVCDELLAIYLINHGHKPINRTSNFISTPIYFYDTQELHDDVKEYDDLKNLVRLINGEINVLTSEIYNYPDIIEDVNDYMCLFASINKLIKLRAIITAYLRNDEDKLSIARRERYFVPVIECYSDTSKDLTDSMIKYKMMYSKCPVEYVDYDEAMFDYRKDRVNDNL